MAERTRDELKSYFASGKRPTGQQFADLIDSVLNTTDDTISIDGNDNVGIGIDNPSTQLHVFNNESNGLRIESGNWPEWDMISNTNDHRAKLTLDPASGALQFRLGQGAAGVDSANDTKLLIDQNGNVGIGTNNPNTKLEINAPNKQLRLTDSDDGKYWQLSSSSNALAFRYQEGQVDSKLALWLNSEGNVGIGAENPDAKLELSVTPNPNASETIFKATIDDASDDYFLILNATGENNQFIPALKGYHASDNRASLIISGEIPQDQDNGNNPVVAFDARQPAGPITTRPLFQWASYTDIKMTMGFDGDLGIGTDTPNAKLDVNGKANISESLSTQNGRVRRDFITWNTIPGGTTPIHIKTNIPRTSNTMYRILVEGYAHGASEPINSEAVGYAHHGAPIILSTKAINHAMGITAIDQYYSSDPEQFVVVKLTPANSHYIGFSASAWFTNPNGNGFDISAEVFHQEQDL